MTGVLFRLGRRYFGARRGLTALYLAGSLLTVSVLPVAVVMTYGQLTTYFHSEAAGGSGADAMAAATPTAPPREGPGRVYVWWVVLVLGTAALTFGHGYVTALFSAQVERDIRADVFSSLLQQSPRFFHEHSSNELTMVATQLSSQAQMALRQVLLDPFVSAAGLAVTGFALYQALARLSADMGSGVYAMFAGIAIFAVVSLALVTRMGGRLQRQTSAMQSQEFAMATLVGGALAAPEEVQAMQAEARFAQKYRDLLARGIRARLDQTMTMERVNTLNDLPGSVVLIALIGVAIYLLGESRAASATSYTIVAVGLLTPQLMGAVQSLASVSINANLTWPAVEMVDQVMQSPSQLPVSADARDIDLPSQPALDARNVTFSYQPGAAPNVLDNVSFSIAPGAIVGLVARSGSGKTTLFRLLLRFYDAQRGDIVLGGQSIRSCTIQSLRRHVALMTQESAFFHDTIRENFRVAAPDASDDQIKTMCLETGMWPILESTFGSRPLEAPFVADMLSGGQRKRFALTRILLRRPSLILLDEPTVGIDPVDTLALVDVIKKACAGRMVIAVDHDLVWQTRLCDRFLVLDAGAIVQAGTSAELLAQRGLFRDLYEASRNEQLRHPPRI